VSNQYILPLAIGLLWSYLRTDQLLQQKFILDQVVYRKQNITEQAKKLAKSDIVCFSSYVWNKNYHIKLAKQIKKINPKTFILFGGPSAEDNDIWLLGNRIIDLALVGEGEQALVDIFKNFDTKNFNSLPGVRTPTIRNEFPTRINKFEYKTSPFVMGFYDTIVKELQKEDIEVSAVIQTNRGCPYGCTFCGSGADYYNKVHKYDLDRVQAEVEWCGQNKIDLVILADENFGIFSRDLDIMRFVIEAKIKYTFPKTLDATFAKKINNTLIDIIRLERQSGTSLLRGANISLQSRSKEVLEAVDRYNPNSDEIKNYVAQMKQYEIPATTELIWPLPKETIGSLKFGFDDLRDLGIDNFAALYPLMISDDIEMPVKFANDLKHTLQGHHRPNLAKNKIQEQYKFVNETSWAPFEQVVQGNVWYNWLVCLYYFGYARYVIEHLISQKNISLSQCIDFFIAWSQQHPKSFLGQCHKDLTDFWSQWLINKETVNLSVFPDDDCQDWYSYSHLAVKLYVDREKFYKEMTVILQHLQCDNVSDLIEFSKHSLIDKSKIYPYQQKIADQTYTIELKKHAQLPDSDDYFNFCRFYFHWKKTTGWVRTNICIDGRNIMDRP
jgi:putative methyltransferase